MNAIATRAGGALHRAKMLAHRAGFDVTRATFKRHFVHSLHRHGVDTVLDIGANVGQFAAELRRARFDGHVLSVEPLRSAFAQLEAAAAGDPNWDVLRSAVGAAPGTLTMNVSANSVSSSTLPMLPAHVTAAPGSRYVATETVPATTVDALVAEHALDPGRLLVKIDVQGYEKPVLDGAASTLARVAAVRTEMSLVPLYEGQALLPELLPFLLDCGLELWSIEPGFVEPATGRLLQVDAIFFRKDEG